MRAKRSKQYRKLMHQYGLSFRFREPYQVLLDAQIIKDAAKFKMRLGSLLETTLHGAIKPMITQCCIRHLYESPTTTLAERKEKDAWIEVAKGAERRRCGHHELDAPLATLQCLESVIDPSDSGANKHRYIVACQDVEVRARMRAIAGVPLIYINRSVMILEPMAARSEEVRNADERAKVRAGLKGRKRGTNNIEEEERKRKRRREDDNDGNDEADPDESAPAPKKKALRGPKGPNPLSMKKSKKDKLQGPAGRVENERAVFQKAAKGDPQAVEKEVDAGTVGSGEEVAENTSVTDGPRKRKRKRKLKEGRDSAGGGDEGDDFDKETRGGVEIPILLGESRSDT